MSVAALLHRAMDEAAAAAEAAARQERFAKAREWQALAAELDRLYRDAIAAMSS
jgi:hypothetical protein